MMVTKQNHKLRTELGDLFTVKDILATIQARITEINRTFI